MVDFYTKIIFFQISSLKLKKKMRKNKKNSAFNRFLVTFLLFPFRFFHSAKSKVAIEVFTIIVFAITRQKL